MRLFLITFGVLLGAFLWATFGCPGCRKTPPGDEEPTGEWLVVYPDGKTSQPLDLDTARDYATIFGGILKRKPPTT